MLTTLYLWEGRGRSHDVFYTESVKVPPLTSGSTTIAVEGTSFAYGFTKNYDHLLLPTSGRVFDFCRAFDRFSNVHAHHWLSGCFICG